MHRCPKLAVVRLPANLALVPVVYIKLLSRDFKERCSVASSLFVFLILEQPFDVDGPSFFKLLDLSGRNP
jgi:hypothetical protein